MNRPIRLACVALVVALGLAGCASQAGITASGRVDDPTVKIMAPALGTPVERVASVEVIEGQHVDAGQLLLSLDGAVLDAALAQTKADAGVANAQPGVLTQALADIRDKRADLVSKRADVVKAIDTLTGKRPTVVTAISTLTGKLADLGTTIAGLVSTRAALVAQIAQLTAQRQAAAAAGAPTASLDAALAQANAGLAQLDSGLAQARAGRAQLTSALTQAKAGLVQIDAGLVKARDGLAKIDDGLARIDDGTTTLINNRDLASIGASAAALAVNRAELNRGRASVTAPQAGVVVSVAHVGDTLAPGATLAIVRPTDAPAVTTWIGPEQGASVCVGATATVKTDWGTTLPATVDRVGVRSEYPPTSLATLEVHLTRAVGVHVVLDADAQLPPGVGVDVTITPCQTQP